VAVLDGGDPVEEQQQARRAATLKEFAVEYIDRHARPRKKSWPQDERRLKSRILPALGSRKLAAITRNDVARLHQRIGENASYEANRTLALLRKMFALAEQWGVVPEGHPNPARGVEPYRERSRDRWVTPEEMPRLMAAINEEP